MKELFWFVLAATVIAIIWYYGTPVYQKAAAWLQTWRRG